MKATPLARRAARAFAALGAVVVLAVQATPPAASNATPEPPTLAQALEAAWARHPWPLAQANRREELRGKQEQNAAWFAGEPALTLAHTSDRLGSQRGKSGFELGWSAPLWQPKLRQALLGELSAQTRAQEAAGLAAQHQLAGELRQSATRVALARIELTHTQRLTQEASLLLADASRRVAAGDAPRVDALAASAALEAAEAQRSMADAELASALATWRASTGLAQAAELPAFAPPLAPVPAAAPTESAPHPGVAAAAQAVALARAKLGSVNADSRGPVELALAASSDRAELGARRENGLRVQVRVPLGGAARNGGKLAGARADLDEANALHERTEREVAAALGAARARVAAAHSAHKSAAQRVDFITEAHALYAKAYSLGQVDLATRLRAHNEKFEAELAASRATVHLRAAQSQLQHAMGLLP